MSCGHPTVKGHKHTGVWKYTRKIQKAHRSHHIVKTVENLMGEGFTLDEACEMSGIAKWIYLKAKGEI